MMQEIYNSKASDSEKLLDLEFEKYLKQISDHKNESELPMIYGDLLTKNILPYFQNKKDSNIFNNWLISKVPAKYLNGALDYLTASVKYYSGDKNINKILLAESFFGLGSKPGLTEEMLKYIKNPAYISDRYFFRYSRCLNNIERLDESKCKHYIIYNSRKEVRECYNSPHHLFSDLYSHKRNCIHNYIKMPFSFKNNYILFRVDDVIKCVLFLRN